MKKVFAIMLCIVMIFSLSSCDELDELLKSLGLKVDTEVSEEISKEISEEISEEESIEISEEESVEVSEEESVEVSEEESTEVSEEESIEVSEEESIEVSEEESIEESQTPVAVTAITLTASKTELYVGETSIITASVTPVNADNKGVTFAVSSGSSNATITSDGTLTAVKVGTVTVTATASDGSGVKATINITVKPVKATKLTLSAAKTTITVGDKLTVVASVTPANADDKSVTFSISKGSSLASIDKSGVLTAKGEGSVTVKAVTNDGSKLSATLNVTIKAKALHEGSGTKSDPYLIKSESDLKNLSAYTKKSGLYFKQTADIALTAEWTPIEYFDHNYDGQGYAIKDLKISGDKYRLGGIGLFASSNSAVLQNIVLQNVDINVEISDSTGALVGGAIDTTITNVKVTGTVCNESGYSLGGIVGTYYISEGKASGVTKCTFEGTVNGTQDVGGIVGNATNSHVEDEDPDTYASYHTPVTIGECAFYGKVTGNESVGGIVGNAQTINITKCYTDVTVEVKYRNAGGIVGEYLGGYMGSYKSTHYTSYISENYSHFDIKSVNTSSSYGNAFFGGIGGWVSSFCGIDIRDNGAVGTIYCNGTWSSCQDRTTYDGGLWDRYRNPCGALIAYLNLARGKLNFTGNIADAEITWAKSVCTDDLTYCRGSLVGWFKDTATRDLIKDEYKASGKAFSSTWYVDITESMLKDTIMGCLDNNYCVSTDRNWFESHPRIVIKSSSYASAYKSMPRYTYVNNITKDAYKLQSTFAGLDFTSRWTMTASGPVPTAVMSRVKHAS